MFLLDGLLFVILVVLGVEEVVMVAVVVVGLALALALVLRVLRCITVVCIVRV